MSAYTDEADKVISAAHRPVEPGDLVTHEDDIGGALGRVFSVGEDTIRVIWSQTGECVPVRANRLHLLERPEAYACVTVTLDEVTNEETSYCFVTVGTPTEVQRDLEVYRKASTYAVTSFRVAQESETTPAQ